MPGLAIRWHAAARADLLSIVDYIADDNPDAALRLNAKIGDKVAGLSSHPKLYKPGRVEGTREMLVGRHYIVVYAEDDIQVTILRILHAARQWPP